MQLPEVVPRSGSGTVWVGSVQSRSCMRVMHRRRLVRSWSPTIGDRLVPNRCSNAHAKPVASVPAGGDIALTADAQTRSGHTQPTRYRDLLRISCGNPNRMPNVASLPPILSQHPPCSELNVSLLRQQPFLNRCRILSICIIVQVASWTKLPFPKGLSSVQQLRRCARPRPPLRRAYGRSTWCRYWSRGS